MKLDLRERTPVMRDVRTKIIPYSKNYYETVLKKNKSEDFLFFKSDYNKLSIFSDLGCMNQSPLLFAEIENIKGERLTDFDIIDAANLKFNQGETFSPTNYKKFGDSNSQKLNKMIVITLSADGFVCPYMI